MLGRVIMSLVSDLDVGFINGTERKEASTTPIKILSDPDRQAWP